MSTAAKYNKVGSKADELVFDYLTKEFPMPSDTSTVIDKGRMETCRVTKEMRNECLKEGERCGAKEIARRMLTTGKYSIEEIAEITALSLANVKELQT